MALSDALQSAARLAELVSRRGAGPLAPSPRIGATPGDLCHVLLLAPHREDFRVAGLLVDFSVSRHVIVQGSRAGVPALVAFHLHTPEAEALAADALAEACRGFDRIPLGALDVARSLLDALMQILRVDGGRWRLTTGGEWSGPRSSAGVELGGEGEVAWPNLFQALQLPDGAQVSVPGSHGGPEPRQLVKSPEELRAALPGWVEAIREALLSRETFFRRDCTAAKAAERILAAIDGAAPGVFSLHALPRRYPSLPEITLLRTDALGAHPAVSLEETPDGLRIRAGSLDRTLQSLDEVEALLGEIRTALRDEANRLSPDTLEAGKSYRVLQAFGPFQEGERVTYEGSETTPRDDWVEYSFSARTHAGRVVLHDRDGKDAQILERLHEYLGR